MSWRLRIVRGSAHVARGFRLLTRLVGVFQSAIPVGLLRRNEIDRLVWTTYGEAPDFYDPLRYGVRYEEQILAALERHLGPDRADEPRLLDLYCGHGREAEIFAQAGYRVTGVDVQPEVIDRARAYAAQAGFDAEFLVADVERWRPPPGPWDVVYTSLWMYSTVPGRSDRVAWTRRISEWAAPEGVTVISVKPRIGRLGGAMRHMVARTTAALTRNPRRPERGDRIEKGLFWHDATAAEVAAELHAAEVEVLDRLEIGGPMPCIFYLVRR